MAIRLATCNMPFGVRAAWAGWRDLSRAHTATWACAPGSLPSSPRFLPGRSPPLILPYQSAVSPRGPGELEGRPRAKKYLRRNDLLCKQNLI